MARYLLIAIFLFISCCDILCHNAFLVKNPSIIVEQGLFSTVTKYDSSAGECRIPIVNDIGDIPTDMKICFFSRTPLPEETIGIFVDSGCCQNLESLADLEK